jgi:hypothetical protein
MNVLPAARHKTVLVIQMLEYRLSLLEQHFGVVHGRDIHLFIPMFCSQESCANDQGSSRTVIEREVPN